MTKQSRSDNTHEEDGLCFVLLQIFNVMAEVRLKAEYGDYLAYTCAALKGEGMNEKMDWQDYHILLVRELKRQRSHFYLDTYKPSVSYLISILL